ncbi:MAG: nuclease A inhibitor family protein, partial [Pyrinomonadaceae bacterium]
KNDIFFREGKKNTDSVLPLISRACEGLVYISETDAPVTPVDLGAADSINGEMILQRAGLKAGTEINEVDADRFFAKLTAIKDWQTESQKARAKKFLALGKVLEKDLRSLKVYRFGQVRIDILIVGLDDAGHILGVRTNAVET